MAHTKITTRNITDDAVTSAKLDTNIDLAGTLDVTGATTLDSTLSVAGNSLVLGANDNEETLLTIRYSTVPAYISSTYDGTSSISAFSANQYNTDDGSASLSSAANTAYANAAIKLYSGTGDSSIRFYTATAANTNPTEYMRVDHDGKVGIGATSPSTPLHVKVASRSTAYDADNAATWADSIVMNPSGADTSATGIAFYNNGTYHTNAASGIALVKHTASSDYGSDMAFIVRPQSAVAIEGMRLTSAGKLGIGETSPDRPLHICGPDGTTGLVEGNSRTALFLDNAGATYINLASANNSDGGIFFSDPQANNRGGIRYSHADDDMYFTVAAGEALRITSDRHLIPGADNAYDLGSTSARWRNVYTTDLHLSNMISEGTLGTDGKALSRGNDVDGTTGDWTIQEGAEDLFLVNNNTGKKYKFNLTEV